MHVWHARGLPAPAAWLDTLPHARAAGLPGKLDQLGQRLFGRGKDEEGARLVKKLCRPNDRGEFRPLTRLDAARLLRYNVADVLLLARLYQAVDGKAEPEVLELDRLINGRGVALDRELAEALIRLEREAQAAAAASVEGLTEGRLRADDLRSDKKIKAWLRSRGVSLPNLQKGTVQQQLARADLDPAARGVLEARQAVKRIATSKLENALAACDDDGRLRHLLVYHKAHTGRWAGRKVQPHNLPRPHKDLEDVEALLAGVGDADRFRQALPAGVAIADAVAALIRPCFVAPAGKLLVIADLAGVEARGVAWCAGETRQLELFARGADNYLDFGGKIFGRPVTKADKRERAVGKEAVLGCGYSMGARKFAERCGASGVDLAAAGTTAEEVVEGYRDAYPAIAGTKVCSGGRVWRRGGLWRDVEAAARAAIQTGAQRWAGKCTFFREGTSLVIGLS
jgi:DNA polymerase